MLQYAKKIAFPSPVAEVGLGNKVHFDLAPHRYIAYESALQLRDMLKSELDAWYEQQR